jgi:hypothetical protein
MQQWKGFLPDNAIVMAKSTGVAKPGAKPRAQTGASASVNKSAPQSSKAPTQSTSAALSPRTSSSTHTSVATSVAKLIFIGDAIQGQAAQLLDRMIEAMGVARANVSIVASEAASAMDLSTPHILVALGENALRVILQSQNSPETASISTEPFANLRSRFLDYRGSKLIAVFHPSELLKSPQLKKDVWADLQKVVKEMGIELPKRN